MAIEADRVLGAPATRTEGSWDGDDVILYHLGIGAGADPTNPEELCYVLEDRLKVLPTFGVLMASAGASAPLATPGLEFSGAMMLHGEQEIVTNGLLPTGARVVHEGRVSDLWDKGKAAVAVIEVRTSTTDGSLLCTNRFGMFLRGAGGFGGDSGPKRNEAEPATSPDEIIEIPSLPRQALIYRMCGDRNPLHSDPEIARLAGFERPILHGQCWYGMSCKALVDTLLDGDVGAVASWSARFAGNVYPGETLVLSCWKDGDRLLVKGDVAERKTPALAGGVMQIKR
jgi:acyl dehydratase